MKINRFVAPGAIGLLILGAMGVISMKAFAQDLHPYAQSQTCGAEQVDGAAETRNSGTDTENVDQQCGDQNTPDAGAETTVG